MHCLGLPYWHYQLVLSCYLHLHQPKSRQLSLDNMRQFQTLGRIDQTPGIPGPDENIPNRACMPCIFFYIFNFCKKRISCAYQLSKVSRWTCYDQNIPNRSQQTINIFKLYWRTSSYAVHFCTKKWRTSSYAHTFLLHFKFFKTDFLCLQAT